MPRRSMLLFLREYRRRRHSLPDFPEARPFEGGYTDIFQDRHHRRRVALRRNLRSIRPGHAGVRFPAAERCWVCSGVIRDLCTPRVQAKNELRQSTCPVEAISSTPSKALSKFSSTPSTATRICLGHFADFTAAEAVTAGWEILRQMVDWLNGQGASVIEIDTTVFIFIHLPGLMFVARGFGAAELPPGSRWSSTSAIAPCSVTR